MSGSIKSAALRLLLSLLATTTTAALAATDRVADFALLDQHGRFHQLSNYGDSEAVVIIAMDASCTSFIDNLSNYQLLRTTWERQGISFLGINFAGDVDAEQVRQMALSYHLDLPVLQDSSQLVAESLGLTQSGEIVVIEPERLRLLFRGGMGRDSSQSSGAGLSGILSAAVNDRLFSQESTLTSQAGGCPISFPARDQHAASLPDYGSDIAPILQSKCASCHVEGGIAPFAMNSHLMVRAWSPMMKEAIMTRRMPPMQVDPEIRHFSNAHYLNPQQKQALIHWIDGGAPRGTSEVDPLVTITTPSDEWQLGEPDYIVEVPAFKVPATGVLDYESVTINLPFEEDLWIKSVQHLPGDRRVLHHLLSFIVPAGYSEKIVEGENDRYREFLEGYAPGKNEAATFPDGTGVFVPAGSAVQMSLHYTTFGKETVDATRLGLYFAAEQPKYQYSTYALSNGGTNLRIPPGVSEHKMNASHVFEDEVMLYGLRPHMHYRGKYMRMSVAYPDGTRDEIINVPDYSFAWQPTYRLTEPMLLPAGSRVLIEGAFDNSHYNLGNPDPEALVVGGAQSWNEMFIGYFSYYKIGAN